MRRNRSDVECGDLSPLLRLADLSAKQSRVQRRAESPRSSQFDGDKSPAESGDESPHAKFLLSLREASSFA
jgi:hypothetical protein